MKYQSLLAIASVLMVARATVFQNNCHEMCDGPLSNGAGTCDEDTGQCICSPGWTGPGGVYDNDDEGNVIIRAQYCTLACFYTNGYINDACAIGDSSSSCDSRCGSEDLIGTGTCVDGRCECTVGWTGPNAEYILDNDGGLKIMADYCDASCFYLPTYWNTDCVPSTTSPPPLPTEDGCDARCGSGIYAGAGTCHDGQCICSVGWTGPSGEYFKDESGTTRVVAEFCDTPCFYTDTYAPSECADVGTLTGGDGTCDPSCGTGEYVGTGECFEGACRCHVGWTGASAEYHVDEEGTLYISAVNCNNECFYTSTAPSSECASTDSLPEDWSEPSSGEENDCHSACGDGMYTGTGTCGPSGRCLCTVGWTGPNAEYYLNEKGSVAVAADYCDKPCFYSENYSPDTCADATSLPTDSDTCDSRCGTGLFTGAGTCTDDGTCLCAVGWTGPDAFYLFDGDDMRIMAQFCNTSCHYANGIVNSDCADASYLPSGDSNDDSCEARCGGGSFVGTGSCVNDDCVCTVGWTGPDARYHVDDNGNYFITASNCDDSCFYTNDLLEP